MSAILNTNCKVTVHVHVDPPILFERSGGKQSAITHVTVIFEKDSPPWVRTATAVVKKDGTVGQAGGGYASLHRVDELREDVRALVVAGYEKAVREIGETSA